MARSGYGRRKTKTPRQRRWDRTVRDLKKQAKPFKDAAKAGKKTYRKLSRKKKGCYIATCVYGSYDCPEVWTLRRYRDYSLAESFWGRLFIQTYYAISPALVSTFGKTKWFQSIFKRILDKKVYDLNSKGYDNTPYNDTSN